MLDVLRTIFGGGGTVDAIERIATEWIETDLETEEAKAVRIKALDPNGAMRREISRTVSHLFKLYVYVTLGLIILEFFGIGMVETTDPEGVALNIDNATAKLRDLFVPISSLFGVIVSASFGVNYANVKKEQKQPK